MGVNNYEVVARVIPVATVISVHVIYHVTLGKPVLQAACIECGLNAKMTSN
jgi:hypothetical protein